jgi:beta-fructofuranosidase
MVAVPGRRDPKLLSDPHRPRYHFLPPANWQNDPNGLIEWQGQYHLFYQYNPHGAFHGTIHWGHAVSADLVHWDDWPIALAPTPGGPDAAGCYSGCAVDHDGVPTMLYTGIRPEVQCLATSGDDLVTWQKHPANPVIAAPPPGLTVLGFRDPFVWREDDGWYAVIGSGLEGVGGAALLYQSSDLVHWRYRHPLCVGQAAETGTMWECPNFFPLGDRHVLILSPIPLRKSIYLVGRYRAHRFVEEARGVLDDGGHYYAPQVLADSRGRRLSWGWLTEGRSPEACQTAGWNGVMSLPAVLGLDADGQLTVTPAPELERLRQRHLHRTDPAVRPAGPNPLAGIEGDCLEVATEVVPENADAIALAVRRSADGAEQTRVVYDPRRQWLGIDRRRASADPATARAERGTSLRLAPGEALRLRVFLDRSVLEVFANDRVRLSSRIYPTRPDSLGLAVETVGAAAPLPSLDVWQLAAIWPTE